MGKCKRESTRLGKGKEVVYYKGLVLGPILLVICHACKLFADDAQIFVDGLIPDIELHIGHNNLEYNAP